MPQAHARCRCLYLPVDEDTALGHFSRVISASTLPTMMTMEKALETLSFQLKAFFYTSCRGHGVFTATER